MSGFIYILSNPAMPNLLKIGKSDRDPSAFRAEELYTTGVPQPFKVEYFAYVEDHHRLESILHTRFDKQRPNKNREFFTVRVEEAVLVARQSSKILYEKIYYKTEADIIAEQQKAEREKQDREREDQRLKEQERWKQSLVFAEEAAINEKEKYKLNYPKIFFMPFFSVFMWSWLGLVCLLWIWVLIFGEIPKRSIGLFLLSSYSVILAALLILRSNEKSKLEEKASAIFSDSIIQEVATRHYLGKDWKAYLEGITNNKIAEAKPSPSSMPEQRNGENVGQGDSSKSSGQDAGGPQTRAGEAGNETREDWKQKDQQRWQKSLAFANSVVDKEKVKYINECSNVRRNYLIIGAMATVVCLTPGKLELAVVLIGILALLLLFYPYAAETERKKRADTIFCDAVVQEVASRHFHDGDWELYLRRIVGSAKVDAEIDRNRNRIELVQKLKEVPVFLLVCGAVGSVLVAFGLLSVFS